MKRIIPIILLVITTLACSNEEKNKPSYGLKSSENKKEKSDLMKKATTFFQPISSITYEAIPDEKVALGKQLYNDKRLSKNNTISCNSCHQLNNFGVDNLPTSPGDSKELGDRNSPSTFYASFHTSQFWDGRAKDVEEQAGMPILNPIEHGIPDEEYLVNKLRKIEEYQNLFAEIYKEEQPITFENITNAIGAFERKLYASSRFDEYLDGDEKALNTKEKKGLQAFIDNQCITCHTGVALGGHIKQKFGLFGNYWEMTGSKKIDTGLHQVTGKDSDKYIFKVPSLRNIEKTNPYFHDGSVDDLAQAVKIMGKLQSNKDISEKDVDLIIAFLKTLTADIDDELKS
ncbi:cytochrome-c peroxidase [Psychroflexus maritimus]|uniref:C-type cytochrome n=1 Tax=Psychroflexus maritimus TaxID=2714865 RepID=A0A967AI67_9FLAO|nr:cytochrome c peroxidase [Psychroflexus maritimus]NGZ89805.1 c-type cytochrome [Psychroflexus maritimus]